jgi:hypothetical protein
MGKSTARRRNSAGVELRISAAVFAGAALDGLVGGALCGARAAFATRTLFDQVLKLVGHREASGF